jgi:HEAT repeat protein
MANNGYIIHSLQALHAEPSQVIAILEKKLQSGNALTQYWASAALASYGSEAESSVPALLRSATGPDPILRAAVFRALEQIGPEISRTNLSLLDIDYRDSTLISSEITSLQSWGPFDRRIAAYRLGKFGAAAESAMPALLKATKDEDEKVCAAAREALKSINPEAARKAGVE